MNIRIHAMLQHSLANGPGTRAVVWLQGCDINCPGCFNPLTHDIHAGKILPVKEVCRKMLENATELDGLSISGGEPFCQPESLYALLSELRSESELPLLVFSGYSWEALNADPRKAVCLGLIDALICGPYKKELPPAWERFCSSSNQQLKLLSTRYLPDDFRSLPLQECIISNDGTMSLSGLIDVELSQEKK